MALIATLFIPFDIQAHGVKGCRLADPTGGGVCSTGPVKLSARDVAIGATKTKLANEYAAARAGKVSYAQYWSDTQAFMNAYDLEPIQNSVTPPCIAQPTDGCAPASHSLSLTQQAQINNYYCGPAAASEMLREFGLSYSQSTLAGNAYLETIAYGETPWSDNNGNSPMQITFNKLEKHNYYYPQSGSGVGGTTIDAPTYENDLVWDIVSGYPIAGNVYEQANNTSPHLWGHPTTQAIGHWIAIYGYSSYGGGTSYADSVYGSVIHWPVKAYNVGYPSPDMATMLNQRGFVW